MLSDLIFLLEDPAFYEESCEICQAKFKRERWKVNPKTQQFADKNKKCPRCKTLTKLDYSVFMKYIEEKDRRLENIKEFTVPCDIKI